MRKDVVLERNGKKEQEYTLRMPMGDNNYLATKKEDCRPKPIYLVHWKEK